MDIEILEFYPYTHESDFVDGTLKVKLTELNVILMGIYIVKKEEKWFFRLPGRKCLNHNSAKEVRYPYFCMEDKAKQKLMTKTILEKAKAYIEKSIADNSIMKPQKYDKKAKINTQKKTPHDKIPSAKVTEWKTPPPAKFKRSSFFKK